MSQFEFKTTRAAGSVETVSARVADVAAVVAKDVVAVVETDSMGTGTAKMGLVGLLSSGNSGRKRQQLL